jgi:hypothetical protein
LFISTCFDRLNPPETLLIDFLHEIRSVQRTACLFPSAQDLTGNERDDADCNQSQRKRRRTTQRQPTPPAEQDRQYHNPGRKYNTRTRTSEQC